MQQLLVQAIRRSIVTFDAMVNATIHATNEQDQELVDAIQLLLVDSQE